MNHFGTIIKPDLSFQFTIQLKYSITSQQLLFGIFRNNQFFFNFTSSTACVNLTNILFLYFF
nr:MAG TPA: hypothetical protein [Caudoviricetes sp.]